MQHLASLLHLRLPLGFLVVSLALEHGLTDEICRYDSHTETVCQGHYRPLKCNKDRNFHASNPQ